MASVALETPPIRSSATRRLLRLTMTLGCITYLAIVLALWVMMVWAGPRFWPATLFLYGPRWVVATPLALLVPFTLWLRPRAILWLILAAPVLLVPVLGARVPYQTWVKPRGVGVSYKVMTCNLEGAIGDPVAFGRLIQDEAPDLVVITECPTDLKAQLFAGGGWDFKQDASDVGIASRYPIVDYRVIGTEELIRPGSAVLATIQTPEGSINVAGVHLPTPRAALEMARRPTRILPAMINEIVALQWHESDVIHRWITREASEKNPTLVVGDFNLTVETVVYRKIWSEYENSFDKAGWGFGSTKYTSWFTARIDHILHNFRWRAKRCWAGPDVSSDHRPILAELEWLSRS